LTVIRLFEISYVVKMIRNLIVLLYYL